MSSRKILYVCQEITPYLPETEVALLCRALSQGMQERGYDIRTFMPKYGCINERRNQLHEVIRLSGMNLIIDNNDHQLIIKVASIPSARVQVYFIDNEDYFGRKFTLTDQDGVHYADNDERSVFFARGVLETVKKLRWKPDIVHCHGWFSSVVLVYLKNSFADDPIFKDVKIVVSLYDDAFPGVLNSKITDKIRSEGGAKANLEIVADPSHKNVMKFMIDHADGIVIEAHDPDPELVEYVKSSGKPYIGNQDKENNDYLDNYKKLYEEL